MFKRKSLAVYLVFIVALIIPFLNYHTAKSLENINYNFFHVPTRNDVYTQQLQARFELMKKALDKFGPVTPNSAALLWAEGVKTRNGALQYAVLCDNLKKKFEEDMDKDNNYSWVTGVSSPWVTKYEITQAKKLSDEAGEYTVKFYWATSAGESEPSENILTIGVHGNKWCITSVK